MTGQASRARLKDCHLVLFFTRDTSLRTWADVGMLDRETALYRRLLPHLAGITFITYGDAGDADFAANLDGIRVSCNRWGLRRDRYRQWLPVLHAGVLRRCGIIKTNQTEGADVAVKAARLWRKPLIARSGYPLHDFATWRAGPNSTEAARTADLESKVFSAADRIVVTTPEMAENVARRVPAAAARTRVIPNYVDTDSFHPHCGDEQDIDVLYVGRLEPQKNVESLLEAVSDLELGMMIVGRGSLLDQLVARFGDRNGRWTWKESVPHADLPRLYGRAKVFALASHYEGHPKTLIEAMACGCAVLGADSPGIGEMIEHDDTGWLCGTGSESIRKSIEHLWQHAGLRERLGQSARRMAVERFSLDSVVAKELALLEEVARIGVAI